MTRAALVAALGGRAAELASQALMLVLLPRLLGANDFGSFAVVQGFVALGSTVAAVGGPTLMSRFVAASPEAERGSMARALLVEGLSWRIAALVAGVTIAAALAVLKPDDVPAVSVACGATALVLTAAGSWASYVALGLGRVAVWSYRYAVQNVATAIVAIAGYAALGVDGALIGLAVGAAVGLAWSSRGWRHVLHAPRIPAPEGTRRFAALLAVSGVSMQVAHRLPVPLVALGAGTVAAGNAAVGIGVALAAISTVAHPFAVAMPAALARGDGVTRAETSLLRLGIRTLAVAGAAALAGAVAGPPLVSLVLGDEFRPAADALGLALAAVPLAGVMAVLGQIAVLRLRLLTRLVASIGGAIVGISLCAALARSLGADAAAIGLLGWSLTVVLVTRLLLGGTGADRFLAAGLAVTAAVLGVALAGR